MKIIKHSMSGYETIVEGIDVTRNFHAFIAIHSTKLGPALGGCRFLSYRDSEDALTDVLRLAKGMTYKNALAGLDLGGGKGVIIKPLSYNRIDIFRAFGELVNSLEGMYYTAEDVATTPEDMQIIRKTTEYVQTSAGNPSPATALGVLRAMESALNFHSGESLKNKTVGVEGLGSVGTSLSRMLKQKGAHVIATDVDESKQQIEDIEFVSTAAFLYNSFDIYAPCALGSSINSFSIDKISSKIICGCANNQLENNEIGNLLFKKDILYVPDYLANAGGVLNVHRENYSVPNDFELSVLLDEIYNRTTLCLSASKKYNLPSYYVADKMAEYRLDTKNSLTDISQLFGNSIC